MEIKDRMSASEFESQLYKLESLRSNTIQLARLILVDGKTKTEAAKIAQMSAQNVSKKMQRVRALLSGYPADWVLVREMMPESLAVEFRARAKAALEQWKNSKS